MRITIVGIGALGSLFAARLNPVADVTLYGHWPAQLRALQKGLTLVDPQGNRRHVEVTVQNDPAQIPPAPAAFVLVKSYQTRAAVAELEQLLQPDGIAVTLQNGLGNVEQISSVVGPKRAVLGSTSEGANIPRPGVVRHAGHGLTYLGRPPGGDEVLLQSLAGVLREAQFQVKISDDLDRIVWGKLAVNAAINPLTALLKVPNGFLAENKLAREVAEQAASEVARVATARGIPILAKDAAAQAVSVARATANNRSSMLQDVLNGRPTEIEAITAAVLRFGRRMGVETPANECLYALVKELNRSGDWSAALPALAPSFRRHFSAIHSEVLDDRQQVN